MARLEAFRAFDYLNNSELLIGGNHLNDKVAAKMHLAAVENGIISILLDYGIVLGIPLLWYLFLFQKEKLSVFPWWNKMANSIAILRNRIYKPPFKQSYAMVYFYLLILCISP